MREEWTGFTSGAWEKEINVRDFIQKNYTPYDGDASFLAGPTQNTKDLWEQVLDLQKQERAAGGVLDMDTKVVSTITSHGAGYLNKDKETIVGFQTDKPFKRSLQVNGGIRMATKACSDNGYEVDPEIVDFYTNYRKTHNAGVFDAYTPEIRTCRTNHIVTGLPDAYGRGRIIGDYRRVALYGVDTLIVDKEAQKAGTPTEMRPDVIRDREEYSEQIRALKELKELGKIYGFDISRPAQNVQEAIQWLYLGYLAAVKEQNGAAMSLGRTSTFIDCYAQRDLANGTFTEEQIQEFIDHFIMKLRCVKFARTPEYNSIFAGDPVWVTESIGGVGIDGRHMVTKTSFRYLHTLENLGAAPEPNLTVLWSTRLPEEFKKYCAKISIEYSSIQYENDDLMRQYNGDDYGIACCVSPMRIGKEMQFFGARANLAKCLLYAINGGVDEKTKVQVGPKYRPITAEYLDYDEVMERYEDMMKWLAGVYVNALNIIHYMHDKYSYESLQMALHDANLKYYETFGIAGLAIVVDSLMAIRKGNVKVIRNGDGIAVDFERDGEYVPFGNSNAESDELAVELTEDFFSIIKKHKMYKNAIPTMSLLTITSNVVYGKITGATPCGRKAMEPFSPGANPMNGRDVNGSVASLNSVGKLPYCCASDGISYTFAIAPKALGKSNDNRVENLVELLDGYFGRDGGQHLNVNVFDKSLLLDAMEHPEKYPQLTIRVSGYAVNFVKLTREQQLDVISRTINDRI